MLPLTTKNKLTQKTSLQQGPQRLCTTDGELFNIPGRANATELPLCQPTYQCANWAALSLKMMVKNMGNCSCTPQSRRFPAFNTTALWIYSHLWKQRKWKPTLTEQMCLYYFQKYYCIKYITCITNAPLWLGTKSNTARVYEWIVIWICLQYVMLMVQIAIERHTHETMKEKNST